MPSWWNAKSNDNGNVKSDEERKKEGQNGLGEKPFIYYLSEFQTRTLTEISAHRIYDTYLL